MTKSYGVDGIPSLWLVGPDGKVVDADFGGDDLTEKITNVIEGYKAGK